MMVTMALFSLKRKFLATLLKIANYLCVVSYYNIAMEIEKKLNCLLRGFEVVATPEECVRQAVIHHLIHDCGYPLESLVIEKALNQLPGVAQNQEIPNRRIDLAVYVPKKDQLKALLLIECKGVPLNKSFLRQLFGYNHYVKALFTALVNQDELKVHYVDERCIRRFPTYAEVLSLV